MRLSKDLLLFGIVVRTLPLTSPTQRRMRKKYARETVLKTSVDRLAIAAASQAEEAEAFIGNQLELQLAERRQRDDVRERLLKDVEPHIKSAAGQLHDYLDLSGLILKQLNVYLAREFPDIDVPEDLDDAPDELQAIYWAARLMEEKVAAFGFFLEPETITASTGSFRLHGAVTKYRKIYQRSYQAKRLTLAILGESYADVIGNREALTIIPHSLIDNAVKYAPHGTRIEVRFAETEDVVTLRVGSFGPKIEPSEYERVFEPFVRGAAATGTGEEGMGFGLAFADRVARAYGQRIRLTQDLQRAHAGCYWTEFACDFPKKRVTDKGRGRPGRKERR